MASTRANVTTNIPARLDRLPWARWHWIVVIGLGITWILDGLEVTIVGTLGPTLTSNAGLGLTDTQAGYAATTYLVGACAGALAFGYLTDRFGRKKLFLVTLSWYLICTLLTAFSWNFWSFALFRMLAGAGIGGEYSAVNSAIDEMIPSRRRGVADIAINGSWWIGTLIGALASRPLLSGQLLSGFARLAAGVRSGRRARDLRAVPAPGDPGEPALAAHPRPPRRCRANRRRDRSRGAARDADVRDCRRSAPRRCRSMPAAGTTCSSTR